MLARCLFAGLPLPGIGLLLCDRDAVMARMVAMEATKSVLDQAAQTHGGLGLTKEVKVPVL